MVELMRMMVMMITMMMMMTGVNRNSDSSATREAEDGGSEDPM